MRPPPILRQNGQEGLYGVVDKRDFAVIVARQENCLVLVNQYRYPVKGRYGEFPQGSWEHEVIAPEDLARAERMILSQEIQDATTVAVFGFLRMKGML